MSNAFKLVWMVCATIIFVSLAVEMVYKVVQDSAFSCTYHHGDLGDETVTKP